MTKTTFPAFPISKLQQVQAKYHNVKTIHIVRHAEGFHNVNNDYKNIRNLDARLTEKGIQQCQSLAKQCEQQDNGDDDSGVLANLLKNTDLVVTSTMTRCIQTALYSFPQLVRKNSIPFLAHESLRETVNYACDVRRPLSQIKQEFSPRVDFSSSGIEEEEDGIWKFYLDRVGPDFDGHRESAELWRVAERGRTFWNWLASMTQAREVVVCTHSAYLRCILSWGQEGGVQFRMEQILDERVLGEEGDDIPLLDYDDEDKDFEEYVRKDYANCELRSFVVAFGDEKK